MDTLMEAYLIYGIKVDDGVGLGYTEYEVCEAVTRIRNRLNRDSYPISRFVERYKHHVADAIVNREGYKSFYYWGLLELGMYIFEHIDGFDEGADREMMRKLNLALSKLSHREDEDLTREFREYRDNHHANRLPFKSYHNWILEKLGDEA